LYPDQCLRRYPEENGLGFAKVGLGLALVAYLLAQRPRLSDLASLARKRAGTLCLALCTGAFVLWAGYQFSLGWIPHVPFRVPAPVFFDALRYIIRTNKNGLPVHLLSEFNVGFLPYCGAGWSGRALQSTRITLPTSMS
jgi:hypothetical protein